MLVATTATMIAETALIMNNWNPSKSEIAGSRNSFKQQPKGFIQDHVRARKIVVGAETIDPISRYERIAQPFVDKA